MPSNNISKNLIATFILGAVMMSSAACTAETRRVTLPDNIDGSKVAAFLAIMVDSSNESISSVLLDGNGKIVPECLLCTREREIILEKDHGLTCLQAVQKNVEIQGKRICRSLTGVTVKSVDSPVQSLLTNHELFYTRLPLQRHLPEMPMNPCVVSFIGTFHHKEITDVSSMSHSGRSQYASAI